MENIFKNNYRIYLFMLFTKKKNNFEYILRNKKHFK